MKPELYLALLNEELIKALGYQEGHRFVFRPPGATSRTTWSVGFEPQDEAFAN